MNQNDVKKVHFLAGRITLEDVLRLVIPQFHVIPIRNNNWEAVVGATQSAFEEWHT
jgi:hypothetical protein